MHPLGLVFPELCLKCTEEEKPSTVTEPIVRDMESVTSSVKLIFGDAQNMKKFPDRSVT